MALSSGLTKNRIHEILEASVPEDGASQAVNIFLIFLIGLNAVALVIGTVQSIYESAPMLFKVFETHRLRQLYL